MSIADWNQMYCDLPSKQVKIPVVRKDHIICSEDEMFVVSPSALQDELNSAMATIGAMSRCFVRPSGTENVVRVYAEALTKADADRLAILAAEAIAKFV